MTVSQKASPQVKCFLNFWDSKHHVSVYFSQHLWTIPIHFCKNLRSGCTERARTCWYLKPAPSGTRAASIVCKYCLKHLAAPQSIHNTSKAEPRATAFHGGCFVRSCSAVPPRVQWHKCYQFSVACIRCTENLSFLYFFKPVDSSIILTNEGKSEQPPTVLSIRSPKLARLFVSHT